MMRKKETVCGGKHRAPIRDILGTDKHGAEDITRRYRRERIRLGHFFGPFGPFAGSLRAENKLNWAFPWEIF